MKMKRIFQVAIAGSSLITPAFGGDIVLPDGFTAEVWLTGMDGLRATTRSPVGEFNNSVYVAHGPSRSVFRLESPGVIHTFASGLTMLPGGKFDMAFDNHGSYEGDLFISAIVGGSGADGVYRVTSDGQSSVFFSGANLLTGAIAFGQGGDFGTDLYLHDSLSGGPGVVYRFSPSGSFSVFASSVSSDDGDDEMVITEEGAFGTSLYITDAGGNKGGSGILRVQESGAVDRFVNEWSGVAIAVGSGSFGEYLYHGLGGGVIRQVAPDGSSTEWATGFGSRIRSLSIDGESMWVTMDSTVYQISPPPPCAADLTEDGELNFFDVSVFLTYFQLGDLTADFTGDGELNFFDVSAFLEAFMAGCP